MFRRVACVLVLSCVAVGCSELEKPIPVKKQKSYRYHIVHYTHGARYGASSAYASDYYTDSVRFEGPTVVFMPFNGHEKLSLMGSVVIHEDVRTGYEYTPR